MNRKWFIIFGILITALGISQSASAQSNNFYWGFGGISPNFHEQVIPCWTGFCYADNVGTDEALTEKQIRQIERVRDNKIAELDQVENEIQRIQLTYRIALEVEDQDLEAMAALVGHIRDLEKKRQEIFVDLKKRVRWLMTPGQLRETEVDEAKNICMLDESLARNGVEINEMSVRDYC